MGQPMNTDSNDLPEWQAQHRERQRARIEWQARLAYTPGLIPSDFTPNVSRVSWPPPPRRDRSRLGGDWSAN